jgi:hypothetical protein
MALLIFAKWWKFTTQKKSVTSLIFILNFQKTWIWFIVISKIKFNFFSNKFDVGMFYVFNVGIIRIILKLILIRSNIFL